MSKDTIFISYSRDDKAFVKNLAQKLRNAGADIWLDEFDIKIGENWDIAIQTALKESEKFLIVLSKTSVASNNVMDEVGFALSENKKVVPVLMEECDIPFRLQRRQFADLTGKDPKGVETLINALGLDASVAQKIKDQEGPIDPPKPKPVDPPKPKPVDPPKPKPVDPPKPKPVDPPKPKPIDPPKPKSKLPIIIVAIVAITAVLVFAFKDQIFPNQDKIAWENANIGNNIQIYEKYLKDFPEGEFVEAAEDSIRKKQRRLQDRFDNSEWEEATTVEKLIEHRTKYTPLQGLHLDLIEDRIIQIENEEADKRIWDPADQAKTVDEYIKYLTNPQEGKSHMDDAVAGIKSVGKSGWLYAGRTDGTIVTEDAMFKYEWRINNGEVPSNVKPSEGDIVIMTEPSRRTRTTLANAKSQSGSTGTWVRNKKAYVLSSVKDGTALFLQVVY